MIDIDWLPPWLPADVGFEEELARELRPGHPLYGVKAVSVARRTDNDDVLFALFGHSSRFAVVHLTWSSRPEPSPEWPATVFFASLEEWIEQGMRKDHVEFTGA